MSMPGTDEFADDVATMRPCKCDECVAEREAMMRACADVVFARGSLEDALRRAEGKRT